MKTTHQVIPSGLAHPSAEHPAQSAGDRVRLIRGQAEVDFFDESAVPRESSPTPVHSSARAVPLPGAQTFWEHLREQIGISPGLKPMPEDFSPKIFRELFNVPKQAQKTTLGKPGAGTKEVPDAEIKSNKLEEMLGELSEQPESREGLIAKFLVQEREVLYCPNALNSDDENQSLKELLKAGLSHVTSDMSDLTWIWNFEYKNKCYLPGRLWVFSKEKISSGWTGKNNFVCCFDNIPIVLSPPAIQLPYESDGLVTLVQVNRSSRLTYDQVNCSRFSDKEPQSYHLQNAVAFESEQAEIYKELSQYSSKDRASRQSVTILLSYEMIVAR